MEYAAFLLIGKLYLFGFGFGVFALLSSDHWISSPRPHVRRAAALAWLFIRYQFSALVISIVGSRSVHFVI
jgi:hypothetical protein